MEATASTTTAAGADVRPRPCRVTGSRSWAERAYPGLVHYNRVAEGGHFAAWEQPQIFAEEMRATFRSLR